MAEDVSKYLGEGAVRRSLDAADIRPSKHRGQNFLVDPNMVKRIVESANIQAGDRVLEVGVGLGSLTVGLIDAGATVVGVEIDPKLAEQAEAIVNSDDLTVHVGDAASIDWSEVLGDPDPTQPWRMVSNLPYSVGTRILTDLVQTRPDITDFFVMVQKEVADRIAADVGDDAYGALSVKLAYHCSAKGHGRVPSTVFMPRPAVDSALVHLVRRPAPLAAADDFARVVTAAFAQRRKTLRNTLASVAGKGQVERACAAAGIDPKARAETVDLGGFVALTKAIFEPEQAAPPEVAPVVDPPSPSHLPEPPTIRPDDVLPDGELSLAELPEAPTLPAPDVVVEAEIVEDGPAVGDFLGQWSAFAKVNLSLEVQPLRPDGYHPYESIAVSVGVVDTLRITRKAPGTGVTTATSTGVEDTLAKAAAERVLAAADETLDIHIEIDKEIPPGAGLGGGSADAAAAMVAVADLIERTDLDLVALAADVGTDVAFCVRGGAARLHGRGELVDPLPPVDRAACIVIVPNVHVATPEVFAAFDEDPEVGETRWMPTWLKEQFPGCSFRNDLEPAATRLHPELAHARQRIESVTGGGVLMSGSGAAHVWFPADPKLDREVLDATAAKLRQLDFAVFVADTRLSGVIRTS